MSLTTTQLLVAHDGASEMRMAKMIRQVSESTGKNSVIASKSPSLGGPPVRVDGDLRSLWTRGVVGGVSTMARVFRRLLIEVEDRLRYSPWVREVLARVELLFDVSPAPGKDQAIARSIRRLCAAARLTKSPKFQEILANRMRQRMSILNPGKIDWKEFVPDVDVRRLPCATILKPRVSGRERGVIFTAFEREWIRLIHNCDLKGLAERYTLVVAPTSSPFNLINFIVPAAYPAPVFSLINHAEDVGILSKISANYRVVPLYTSHWVDPSDYRPRPFAERDVDLIMIAMFGKVKRHHVLFKALKKLPETVRVLLIGQDQDGRTAETIRTEASLYGAEDRLTILENLPHREVVDLLCRSKVSVLLSLREGSAVVVAESLFADTPTALLDDAYNGSRDFLNESTGRFLNERHLAEQLEDFLSRAHAYSPRRWAEAHISCQRSSVVLNEMLKQEMLGVGQEWTRDLATLCWRPYPRLVHPDDGPWMRREREQILEQFGIEIGCDG